MGIEHIIIASATNDKNKFICVRFNCKSAFHRRMVHLVATVYQIHHSTITPKGGKVYSWFRGDENITDEERIQWGYGINDYGPGHGSTCQDCSWKYFECEEKFVEIKGRPKTPKESIADHWNKNNPTIKQKTNYQTNNGCMCDYIETEYICPNNATLPSHNHMTHERFCKPLASVKIVH